MKKLLKSKIYESINNAHRALFTKKKIKYFDSKIYKKNKTNAKRVFGKHDVL